MKERQDFYEFGPFRIDTVKRLLLRDQVAVPIAPRVFETLLALVRNPGRVMEKDELLKTVWSDSFVDESSIANSVSALRKILGQRPNEHTFIVTAPGRGYRFVAEVRVSEVETSKVTQQSGPIQVESHISSQASVSTSVTVSSSMLTRRAIIFVAMAIFLVAVGFTWAEPVPESPGTVSCGFALPEYQRRSGD